MINSRKKGFTLVELVIVIAVVAILAAVLIPTFSNLVKKANAANDTVVAKNMNTALAEYSALNGKPENFDEVLEAIEEAGYVIANLNAKAEGNLYGWDSKNNQIVYINEEGETIYSNTEFNKEDVKIVISGATALPGGFTATVDVTKPETPKALASALESGISVTLQSNVKDVKDLTIPEGSNVILNLGAYEYSTAQLNPSEENQISDYIRVEKGATLTIEGNGGIFNGRGIMNNGGTIIIKEGVTINAVDKTGGGCIRNKQGGKVVIEGGTFKMNTKDAEVPIIDNNGGEITISGGSFESIGYTYAILQHSGKLTITGGSFKSTRGLISITSGELNINGGSFVNNGVAYALYAIGGTISINAGTFNNISGGYSVCIADSVNGNYASYFNKVSENSNIDNQGPGAYYENK